MSSKLRWVLAVALVALGLAAVRLWAWSAILSAFGPRQRQHELAPTAAAPLPQLAATTAAAQAVVPVASGLPLSPRADYRRSPARIAPRPVTAGEPVERDGAGGPVVLPPAPPPAAWEKVEIVSPFGVGTPAPAVAAAVRTTLRERLAECFDRGVQGRWNGLGKAYSTLAPGEAASAGPAILLLEVEQDGAGVRVVDAPVERRGSAGDGTLNCAQGVLRGAVVQAPSEGKRKFRMRFQLRP